MSSLYANRVHWTFWLVALIALIWNAMGSMNYIMQLNPEMVAAYPDSHKALIAKQTWWSKSGFALSVFGGLVAAILMFFRSRFAVSLFAISLFGSCLALAHALTSGVRFSLFDQIMTQVLMVLVPAFFLVYAWIAKNRNKLR